jgi:hypothetical protein
MSKILIEERKGIAIMEAIKLLPEEYHGTHVPSRVKVKGGYGNIKAVIFFHPCYTYCDPVIKISITISTEVDSTDYSFFRSKVEKQEIEIGDCTVIR